MPVLDLYMPLYLLKATSNDNAVSRPLFKLNAGGRVINCHYLLFLIYNLLSASGRVQSSNYLLQQLSYIATTIRTILSQFYSNNAKWKSLLYVFLFKVSSVLTTYL